VVRVTDHVARIQAEWQAERPDVDTSPQGVIGRLHRIANQLTGELTLLYAKYGLSEGEFDVLAALRRAGSPYERAPGEIALHTMVTTGAVTKRVDRLEAAGLVRRTSHPTDRRATLVDLLDPGRELALAATKELNDEVFTAPGIAPPGVTTLVDILTELRRDAGDF